MTVIDKNVIHMKCIHTTPNLTTFLTLPHIGLIHETEITVPAIPAQDEDNQLDISFLKLAGVPVRAFHFGIHPINEIHFTPHKGVPLNPLSSEIFRIKSPSTKQRLIRLENTQI